MKLRLFLVIFSSFSTLVPLASAQTSNSTFSVSQKRIKNILLLNV